MSTHEKKDNNNKIIHGSRWTKNYHVFGAYTYSHSRFIKVTLRVHNLIVRDDAPSAQQTLLIHFHHCLLYLLSVCVSKRARVSFFFRCSLFIASIDMRAALCVYVWRFTSVCTKKSDDDDDDDFDGQQQKKQVNGRGCALLARYNSKADSRLTEETRTDQSSRRKMNIMTTNTSPSVWRIFVNSDLI